MAYNQERYLWQQFAINNIRLREPPELDFPQEAPTVLPELIEAHLQRLGYSIGDLAGMLHVGSDELATLYGISLAPGTKAAHLRIVK